MATGAGPDAGAGGDAAATGGGGECVGYRHAVDELLIVVAAPIREQHQVVPAGAVQGIRQRREVHLAVDQRNDVVAVGPLLNPGVAVAPFRAAEKPGVGRSEVLTASRQREAGAVEHRRRAAREYSESTQLGPYHCSNRVPGHPSIFP